MISAPVMLDPTMDDRMTRHGSAAANGIAPSLMNDAPSSHAALPFSRSSREYSCGRIAVESASAPVAGRATRVSKPSISSSGTPEWWARGSTVMSQ